MHPSDHLMETCPLKHHIRRELWLRYIKLVVGDGKLTKYLTLYSPPMMDIKLFAKQKLVEHDGEKYKGVVAVTYDDEAYDKAISTIPCRPEVLLVGDINTLITRASSDKQLQEKFPFQVINLDYTNSLFSEHNSAPLSDPLRALDELARRQKATGQERYALFITTRAEEGQFAPHFLEDLKNRVDDNIKKNARFADVVHSIYKANKGSELLKSRYKEFVPIGLVKMVSNVLASYRFQVSHSDAVLLVRDSKRPTRWLLHLAFIAQAVPLERAHTLRDYGRPAAEQLEQTIACFVEAISTKGLLELKETTDTKTLNHKYVAEVKELAGQTFEIVPPEPYKSERDENA